MYGRFRGCVLAAALALAACTHSDLRPDYSREPSTAIAPRQDAPLVVEAAQLSAAHGGDSGLRILANPIDALLARLALADRAKYSVDLQYYLFHSDATGKLLAQHLLAAADRGVRVRVLLDDLHQVGNDDVLRALDGHPHIEIRVFNPFHERTSSMWGMGKQFAGDFARLNRRMHNKTFIVDGTVAIVGGRNIGDEYFDAHGDVNFRDMDVMVIGPVIPEIARSFDVYWNSEPSIPIDAFEQKTDSPTDLATVRKGLADNASNVRATQYGAGVLAEAGELKRSEAAGQWSWGSAEFIADDPGKVSPDVDTRDLHMAPRIKEWLDTAQHRILLVSPYFVPGKKGVAFLEARRRDGVEVAVLTNSLASTDADNVYAAYASYRPPLLTAGVEIYELKPDAVRTAKQKHLLGSSSSASSLHSKVMIVDSDHAFVGSMNLDPRSGNLNTECGVIVTSPAFAKALADIFAQATNPLVTYQVKLTAPGSDQVYWETSDNGKTVRFDDAPQTSAWRRMKAGMTRLLPIEGLL